MTHLIFKAISALALSAVLAACGSNVKLSDVPVEDRTAGSTNPAEVVNPSGVTNRGVEPVQIKSVDASAPGPAGAAKIIYFDYDSFVIKAEFQRAIEAHAQYLAANKTRKLAIEGHTDERGGREYNLALGQKRAEAVRSALGLLGVTDAQAEAVSFGKEKPAVLGSDENAFAKNRRAELNYR